MSRQFVNNRTDCQLRREKKKTRKIGENALDFCYKKNKEEEKKRKEKKRKKPTTTRGKPAIEGKAWRNMSSTGLD